MIFKNKINLVNTITLSRVFLVYPLIVYYDSQYTLHIFLWMGFSDFLDGFIARKFLIQSSIGAKLDSYADKFVSLIFGLFLAWKGEIHLYFPFFLMVRDLVITIFRTFRVSDRISNNFGKLKTALIYIYFTIILIHSKFSISFLDYNVFTSNIEYLIMSLSLISFIYSIPQFRGSLCNFIGTGFYLSRIFKIIPGTFTSLFAVGILFSISQFHIYSKCIIVLFLFILHFKFFDHFLKFNNCTNKDPGFYTLDEFIGVAIFWPFMEVFKIGDYVLFFFLFRFFDIIKPFGIKKIQNLNNIPSSFTNIFDDIIASAYSYLILIIKYAL